MVSVGVLLALVGCGDEGGQGSETSTGTDPAATEIESSTSTTTTSREEPSSTTATTTSTIDEAQANAYIEAIASALRLGLGGDMLAQPDAACFSQAVGELSSHDRQTLQTIANDSHAWDQTAGDDTLPLAQAYLGCADPDALVNLLVIGTVKAIDSVPCIADAWRGELTADLVAQSVSYGRGLNDLPPELVGELAAGAAACVPDRVWWVDDIALQLGRETDLDPEAAQCAATAYVDQLGIERAIRLRVLTLSVLTLPPEDQLRLDMAGRCNIDFAWGSAERAASGDCLSGFGSGREATTIVGCEGEHNAEVVGTHDLSSAVSAWPGIRGVQDLEDEMCAKDFDAMTGDSPDDYYGGFDLPARESWEQGGRTITCVIFRDGYEPWQGPSGLVPGTGA